MFLIRGDEEGGDVEELDVYHLLGMFVAIVLVILALWVLVPRSPQHAGPGTTWKAPQ